MYYVYSIYDYPLKCLQTITVDRLKLTTKAFKTPHVVGSICMVHKVK